MEAMNAMAKARSFEIEFESFWRELGNVMEMEVDYLIDIKILK